MLVDVERMASQGLTKTQIAHCLGISGATFRVKQHEYPALPAAIKMGAAKGIKQVTNALFEAAMKGNVVASIFYLKNRAHEQWRDRKEMGVEDLTKKQAVELTDEQILERLLALNLLRSEEQINK